MTFEMLIAIFEKKKIFLRKNLILEKLPALLSKFENIDSIKDRKEVLTVVLGRLINR